MNAINLTIANNFGRTTAIVLSNTTPRQAFESNGISYENTSVNIDGTPIGLGGLDKTFDELGITGERATLFAVQKADNA